MTEVPAQPIITTPVTQVAPVQPEVLPGGTAAGLPDTQFDPEQLAVGISTELEHTKDINVAKEIAKDHLKADKDYYRKLAKMDATANLAEQTFQPEVITADAIITTPIPEPVFMSVFGESVWLFILGV